MKKYKTNILGCFFFTDQSFNDKRGNTNILNFKFNKFEKNKIFNPNQIIFSKSKKYVFRGFQLSKKISSSKNNKINKRIS